MFCSDALAPSLLIFSDSVPQLLYYSHIPSAIVSLVIGLFVFFSNRKVLLNRILLTVTLSFSLLVFLNLVSWANIYSRIVTFAWLLLQAVYVSLSIFSLYLFYVFVFGKDISYLFKLIGLTVLIVNFGMFSRGYTMSFFDLINCELVDKDFVFSYQNTIFFLVFISIIIGYIVKFRRTENKTEKRIISIFTLGIFIFLSLLIFTWQIAGIYELFTLEQYGQE